MKIFIINLKRRPDRLENIVNELSKYNFTNYEVIDAVDGQTEDVYQKYNNKHAKRLNRELTKGEIACALSHQKVYQRIIKSNKGAIVIEDDCPITKEFIDFANNDADINAHVVMLGYYGSNKIWSYKQKYSYEIMKIYSQSRIYFKKDDVIKIGNFNLHRIDEQSYRVDYLNGTHCYYVSVEGAKLMASFNKKVIVEADNVWCYIPTEFNIYAAVPQLVDIGNMPNSDSDISDERNQFKEQLLNNKFYLQRRNNPMWGR